MILYALVCEAGHRFDSWFRDSSSFDVAAGQALVICPACQSSHVTKAIMAPAVVTARRAPPRAAAAGAPVDDTPPADPPAVARQDVALSDESSRELRTLLRNVRDKVVAQGHDVGPRFAAEARRIHDGEAPERQIFGQASIAEVRELLEDGIPILPLPIVPDELN